MQLSDEFNAIRAWAHARGIYEKGDPKTQTLKLAEEMGELSKAIIEKNDDEIKDAIGDMVVVLTNLAFLCNTDIESCINGAYQVIANRTGRMDGGTFIRDKNI